MLLSNMNDITQTMKRLVPYIEHTLGISIKLYPFHKKEADKLPMYLNKGYRWYKAELAGRKCVLAEMGGDNTFSVAQIEKHFAQVRKTMELPVIGLFNQLEAYNRKRLIEKRIAFIVSDKQLYVPDFLIDLKEYGIAVKKEKAKLIPNAQLLIIYHMLNNQDNKQLENKTFKELAVLLGINQMGISRAVDNLKYHEIIEVTGEKEKCIQFRLVKRELWQDLEKRNLLMSPVLKRVYVDEKPNGINMLRSNTSALPEYSNMNPGTQEFCAIGKNLFYGLQKNNALINANEYEGKYCLEVWKYDPLVLTEENRKQNPVDPLSLYLSLKNTKDERIEMALENIINDFVW